MTTLPEWWTVPYPEVTSVEAAAAYVDALGGALTRSQDNGSWVLSTGQQELIRTASPAEIDSFVLGFALAHLICERHGPIGRRAPAPAEPLAAAPAAAPEPVEPVEPWATAAATEPSEADEPEDEPERSPATLSVVPNRLDEENDESDAVVVAAEAGDAGDDDESDLDTESAGAGRRRRRRR